MSWTIRPAVRADAETITETMRIGFEGYRDFAPPGWIPPGAGELARTRARLTAVGTWALVAQDGGAPAGHVGFVPHAGVPGSAHLWSLFVRPAWWGSGLAAELLARAVAEARAQGYRRMRFFTPRDQVRARRFYEREGFAWSGSETLEPELGLVLVEYAREPL